MYLPACELKLRYYKRKDIFFLHLIPRMGSVNLTIKNSCTAYTFNVAAVGRICEDYVIIDSDVLPIRHEGAVLYYQNASVER